MAARIKIAVSSCLLGNAVRYDGEHKMHNLIVRFFGEQFDLLAVCPEMLAGLGVPRPAVQLTQTALGVRAKGVVDPQLDVTVRIENAVHDFLKFNSAFAGFIFKSKSPSCAVSSAKLVNENNDIITYRDGLFVAKLREHLPNLPIIEESQLVTESNCNDFAQRVILHAKEWV